MVRSSSVITVAPLLAQFAQASLGVQAGNLFGDGPSAVGFGVLHASASNSEDKRQIIVPRQLGWFADSESLANATDEALVPGDSSVHKHLPSREQLSTSPAREAAPKDTTAKLLEPSTGSYLGPYEVSLKRLHVTSGVLTPELSPDQFTYVVRLTEPTSAVAIVPEIDRSRPEYAAAGFPVVTYSWAGEKGIHDASSLAMKRQIDLPEDGTDRVVEIKVQAPYDESIRSVYHITFKQAFHPVSKLKHIDGYDDHGDAVILSDLVPGDSAIRKCYVNPTADSVNLNLQCSLGSRMSVNGQSAKGGRMTFRRDKSRHTQVIQVACEGSNEQGKNGHNYIVLVNSDWTAEEIQPPRLTVNDLGLDCVFHPKSGNFECPNPQTKDGKVTLVANLEPTVKYTLRDRSGSMEVRLLHNEASASFVYSEGMVLTATAGQHSQMWTVYFGGSIVPSLLNGLGWTLAAILALLLLVVLTVFGCAGFSGLGVPFGATEVEAALTFVMQFLCCALFLRGSNAMESLATPLKAVSLFWPAPWQCKEGDVCGGPRYQKGNSHFSNAYGMRLWGVSELGNVNDYNNSIGCLFWSGVIVVTVLLFHAGVYVKFSYFNANHTFPHRLRWGNWESRILHWVTFPACVAATTIIGRPAIEGFSGLVTAKLVSGCVLTGIFVFIGAMFYLVSQAVWNLDVCWIWNTSVRCKTAGDSQSGYWVDVHPDQLVTQPVNRSLFSSFFPFQWITTAADIKPVSIAQALFSQEVYPPQEMKTSHVAPSYPHSNNPQIVEVINTRAPSCIIGGQRLICGLLRTRWLDVLFTYEGLTKFHSSSSEERGPLSVPLLVKTSQLSGPVAAGPLAFFFDGTRVPFIRIADFLYRAILGICVGLVISNQNSRVMLSSLTTIGVLSLFYATYITLIRPYSRGIENCLMGLSVITISGTAMGLAIAAGRGRTMGADFFLGMLLVCCVLLALYSCVVVFSIMSAICCPPLEESAFLEKLANCEVIITDDEREWTLSMPGYCKYSTRELREKATEDRVRITQFGTLEEVEMEFTVSEMRRACKTGELTLS